MSCSREWPLTIRMNALFEFESDVQTSRPEISGKPDVENDDVGLISVGQFQPLGTASGNANFVPSSLEDGLFQSSDVLVVLDDQDAC